MRPVSTSFVVRLRKNLGCDSLYLRSLTWMGTASGFNLSLNGGISANGPAENVVRKMFSNSLTRDLSSSKQSAGKQLRRVSSSISSISELIFCFWTVSRWSRSKGFWNGSFSCQLEHKSERGRLGSGDVWWRSVRSEWAMLVYGKQRRWMRAKSRRPTYFTF